MSGVTCETSILANQALNSAGDLGGIITAVASVGLLICGLPRSLMIQTLRARGRCEDCLLFALVGGQQTASSGDGSRTCGIWTAAGWRRNRCLPNENLSAIRRLSGWPACGDCRSPGGCRIPDQPP